VKRYLIFFSLLILLASFAKPVDGQGTSVIKTVVIDAGHGGKDPGAMGKHSKEKDIALAVALKTGQYIKEQFKDIQVVFTRDDDTFVELRKRAQIANESGADVFISIHCNSNPSSQPYGAESYVMGLHKSEDNLETAKTENAAIFFEDDYASQYEGFDPRSDEDYIVLSMFQSATIDQSINLASKVQDQFTNRVGRKDRGVRQAGFWVLYKTTMPGILIELGFLSNAKEEAFLLSDEGRIYMASAIYRAFKKYKLEFDAANDGLEPVSVHDTINKALFFRVQFASYKKEKSLNFRKFRGLKDIKMYEHLGQYKYTSGNFSSYEEAEKLKEEMLKKGYPDIFIVAFLDDQRIPLDEGLEMYNHRNNIN